MAAHKSRQKLNQMLGRILRGIIRGYQLLLSPWLGNHCRFTPSCSDYALESFKHFGVAKAAWLTLSRLLRCHPWHEGGFDPVPKKISVDTHKKTNSKTASAAKNCSSIEGCNVAEPKL